MTCGYLFRSTLLEDDNGTPHLAFMSDSGSVTHVSFCFNGGGPGAAIEVYRGAGTTLLGTTVGPTYNANTWYYIEMQATLGDGTAGSVEVRVNNAPVITLTGIDTKNGGTKTVFDSIRIGGVQSSSHYTDVDDIYMTNGAGSAPYNGYLGDIRVETLLPNGNGTYSDLLGSDGNSTDNYQLVDETTYSASDYVLSDLAGEKDSYTFQDMFHTSGTVRGVMINGIMSKTDTGTRQARLITRTGGANYTGDSETLTTTDLHYKKVWEQNPNTAVDWDIAEVNSAEFGVEGL